MKTDAFRRELQHWWQEAGKDLDARSAYLQVGMRRSRRIGEGLHRERMRTYDPAHDAARNIDFRETARTGELMVQERREERRLPVRIVVDVRPRMWFGTGRYQKREVALLAAAVIGRTAIAAGDPVTLVPLLPLGMHASLPRSGIDLLQDCLRIHALPAVSDEAVEETAGLLLRTRGEATLVVVLSDFSPVSFAESLFRHVEIQNTLFPLTVFDETECLNSDGVWQMPHAGLVTMRDWASSRFCVVDTSEGANDRSRIEKHLQRRDEALRSLLRRRGAPFISIAKPSAVSAALRRFSFTLSS